MEGVKLTHKRTIDHHRISSYLQESVSLRLCDTLEAILQMPEPRNALIELEPQAITEDTSIGAIPTVLKHPKTMVGPLVHDSAQQTHITYNPFVSICHSW